MRLWRPMMEICNKTCSEKHSIHLKCMIVNCRQYWCTFWRLVWSRDCKWEVLVHLWLLVSVEVAPCTFVAYSMTGRVIEYQDTWHPCKVVYWLTWHPLGRGVADRLPRSPVSCCLEDRSVPLGKAFEALALCHLSGDTHGCIKKWRNLTNNISKKIKLASKAIQNKPEKEKSLVKLSLRDESSWERKPKKDLNDRHGWTSAHDCHLVSKKQKDQEAKKLGIKIFFFFNYIRIFIQSIFNVCFRIQL